MAKRLGVEVAFRTLILIMLILAFNGSWVQRLVSGFCVLIALDIYQLSATRGPEEK
jgi:hypothetical protein